MTLRHFGIALLAAAALLPLAGSCTKIEVAEADSRVALDYNVALEQPYSLEQPQSKAAPLTKAATAYSTSDTFKSYAWYLPEGKIWDNDKADAVPYFSDVTVKFDTDNKWRGADQSYYWPKLGSLSFWSYSPAKLAETYADKISVTKDGVTLTGWTVDANTNQDIDFMVADFKSDLKANTLTYGYLGVPTLFHHKLAKVTVQVSTASARSTTNDIKLYKVSFKNVYTTGSYSLAQTVSSGKYEGWNSRSGLQGEIELYSNTTGLKLDVKAEPVSSLLYIPQHLDAVNAIDTNYAELRSENVILYIEYTSNGNSYTASKELIGIKSHRWLYGQHITYSVVFGEENEPIEFSGSVGVWGTGNSSDISIGTE